MVGMIFGAALLMVILTVMEGGEMPDWWTMFLCVLAISLPASAVSIAVGPDLWFLGPVVGACCGALAISFLWGMAVQRAGVAAGIYLVIQLGISFGFQAMM